MGILDHVRKMAVTVGISINISKTKIMRMNTINSQPIKIREKTVEKRVSIELSLLSWLFYNNGGSAVNVVALIKATPHFVPS